MGISTQTAAYRTPTPTPTPPSSSTQVSATRLEPACASEITPAVTTNRPVPSKPAWAAEPSWMHDFDPEWNTSKGHTLSFKERKNIFDAWPDTRVDKGNDSLADYLLGYDTHGLAGRVGIATWMGLARRPSPTGVVVTFKQWGDASRIGNKVAKALKIQAQETSHPVSDRLEAELEGSRRSMGHYLRADIRDLKNAHQKILHPRSPRPMAKLREVRKFAMDRASVMHRIRTDADQHSYYQSVRNFFSGLCSLLPPEDHPELKRVFAQQLTHSGRLNMCEALTTAQDYTEALAIDPCYKDMWESIEITDTLPGLLEDANFGPLIKKALASVPLAPHADQQPAVHEEKNVLRQARALLESRKDGIRKDVFDTVAKRLKARFQFIHMTQGQDPQALQLKALAYGRQLDAKLTPEKATPRDPEELLECWMNEAALLYKNRRDLSDQI
jgi:hypothetical protein